MSIKGLAEPALIDAEARGKLVRIGRLNKGERTGYGKDAKFKDFDHFAFTAYASDDKTAAQIEVVFHEVYGAEPVVFPDVRIPTAIAGNFHPEDHAWLYAKKHGENKPSVFMARSDGENIKQLRDPDNPRKVRFHYDGERPHADWTADDKSEYGALQWNGKLYQWQRQFSLDVILTDFNRELYNRGICGYGVVTLQTSSKWDISNLLAEYRGILDTIASFFHNPMSPGDYERKRSYLPLQDIPLQVYRSYDTLTTPSYATKNNPNPAPDARYAAQKWLLHWRIAPSFAAAMQEANDKKQANMLLAVANMPLLGSGYSYEDANRELFPDSQPSKKVIAAEASPTTEWDEDLAVWEDEDEQEQKQPEAAVTAPPTKTQAPELPPDDPLSGATPQERVSVSQMVDFQAWATKLTGDKSNAGKALKDLGFSGWPGQIAERLRAYRLLSVYWKHIQNGLNNKEAIELAHSSLQPKPPAQGLLLDVPMEMMIGDPA